MRSHVPFTTDNELEVVVRSQPRIVCSSEFFILNSVFVVLTHEAALPATVRLFPACSRIRGGRSGCSRTPMCGGGCHQVSDGGPQGMSLTLESSFVPAACQTLGRSGVSLAMRAL